MVHSEAENIALRKTVRRYQQDLTEIHPSLYEGPRFKKLNFLSTSARRSPPAAGNAAGPLLLEPPAEPYTHTFISKIYLAGNDYAFHATYKVSGRFKITSLAFVNEGSVLQRVYWGLRPNPTPPGSFAGWLMLTRIFPDTYVATGTDLPELNLPLHTYPRISNHIVLSNSALIFCFFMDGPQGGDNYCTLTMTLENSPQ